MAESVIVARATTMTSGGERIERLGRQVARLGIGIIFLWFGAMKFTAYEATVIAPFVAHSPALGWLHAALGLQRTADLIGLFEVVTGILLLAGFAKPALSRIGAAMAVLTFLMTLSFMGTTPGVAEPLAGGFPALSAVPGQFLLKDLGLLGLSLFLLGEAAWIVRHRASNAIAFLSLRDRRQPEAVMFRAGAGFMRYALAVIFLWFGAMKFTSYEAVGIAPFIANSPIVGWWHSLFGIQGASFVLGVYELLTGILLLTYRVSTRAAGVGAAMAVITFLITISFLFTTPGVAAPSGFPVLSGAPGQFLLKDIGLLGIALCLLGESIRLNERDASAM